MTPLQYLQTRRLLLAKQLLTDTRMPVAQVALTSGFRSLRRFNAAFARRLPDEPDAGCARAPRSRRQRGDDAARPTASGERRRDHGDARLPAAARRRAPCSPSSRQRAIPGIEAVDGRRSGARVRAGASAPPPAGWLEARFVDRRGARPPLVRAVARPGERRRDRRGAPLARPRRRARDDRRRRSPSLPGAPGLRLPGSVDAFELAVRAVLGQQVTVAGGTDARAPPRRALRQPTSRRRGPTSIAPFPAPGDLADGADRAHRRARHHPQPRRRDPGARRALARARAAARAAARSPERAGRAPARAARHRPLDRALHRDARARLARRLPARRRRGAEGDAPRCSDVDAARRRRARRGAGGPGARTPCCASGIHLAESRHDLRHRLHPRRTARRSAASPRRSARCCSRAPQRPRRRLVRGAEAPSRADRRARARRRSAADARRRASSRAYFAGDERRLRRAARPAGHARSSAPSGPSCCASAPARTRSYGDDRAPARPAVGEPRRRRRGRPQSGLDHRARATASSAATAR